MTSTEITAAGVAGRPEKDEEEIKKKETDEKTRLHGEEKNTPAPDYQDFQLSWTGRLIFFTLAILSLMVSLDGTSISVALPAMATELHGSAMEAFWTGTSFLLCSTGGFSVSRHGDYADRQVVFQPATATLSTIFGRRPVINASLVLFLVGALIAGLANNFTEILRWLFYINFPFIGIAAFFTVFFFRLAAPPGSLKAKLVRIDWIGTILFVGSVSSFVIPLSWGGVMYDWDSWRTLVPLAVGAVGIAVFIAYECYVPAEPMIPQSVFQNRSAAIAFSASAIQGLILWCNLYYLPLYYEAARGFKPIITGVALFPETFTVAPAAVICGFIVTITGRYRWGLWMGWTICTIGLGLLCLLKVHTSTAGWIFLNIPYGLGMGIVTAAVVCTVQASATNKNLTVAVAMVVFFRAFGQAIGIAAGGVIFQNQMRHHLLKYPEFAADAPELSRDAASLVTLIKGIPSAEEQEHLKLAYTNSLRIIWATMCAISGVATFMCAFVKKYDLNRALVADLGLVETREDDAEKQSR
ncbi:major facilitator superfamily domain-containing protein [Aspergillus floccosus]